MVPADTGIALVIEVVLGEGVDFVGMLEGRFVFFLAVVADPYLG